ncbi:SH3 domain-containing protein [Anaerococcus sp. Marseille-Q7828]|uniref:SH3 domain-containing protein n=1 Tax=Anaerococcus sp. Marseille-Q7828 TaxID=3036300 RepID=UPI0024AE6D9A|nr:SH3 domain-containing protein [Anaerococcus sp. Marseille-Q7828]
MRIRKFIYSALILFALTSCNKEEEHYESKNVKVDSVFDKADDSKEFDADKEKSKNEDKAKEEKKEENPADDKAENNNKAEDNDQQANNKPDNNAKKYRVENGVNMRSEANTDADNIVAVIDPGTEITALEEIEQNGKTWIKLEYQGQTGFVVKEFLQEVNN